MNIIMGEKEIFIFIFMVHNNGMSMDVWLNGKKYCDFHKTTGNESL